MDGFEAPARGSLLNVGLFDNNKPHVRTKVIGLSRWPCAAAMGFVVGIRSTSRAGGMRRRIGPRSCEDHKIPEKDALMNDKSDKPAGVKETYGEEKSSCGKASVGKIY